MRIPNKLKTFIKRKFAGTFVLSALMWMKRSRISINAQVNLDDNPPLEFDAGVYRALHHDLSHLSDDALASHYLNFGRAEGRQANRISDRYGFAALVKTSDTALEIGPFANPLLSGSTTDYADYLDQAGLIARANDLGLDASKTPMIKYVLSQVALSDINSSYDAVLSSHCIEHQPDLVRHLTDVEALIRERKGRYFLLIPDKRYCFDHQISESTIAEVIDAHVQKRQIHTLRSVIEHGSMTVDGDPSLYWDKAKPAIKVPIDAQRVKAAIEAWRMSNGSYVDVHAWYFTPNSFVEIIRLLRELGYINMCVERMYPSRVGNNEFWTVLKMAV
jgi:hypothetical protein